MRLIRGARDIWCALSRTCRVRTSNDPTLAWLRRHERDAYRSAAVHRRRANVIESVYLNGKVPRRG